jgi:hypothetical protein
VWRANRASVKSAHSRARAVAVGALRGRARASSPPTGCDIVVRWCLERVGFAGLKPGGGEPVMGRVASLQTSLRSTTTWPVSTLVITGDGRPRATRRDVRHVHADAKPNSSPPPPSVGGWSIYASASANGRDLPPYRQDLNRTAIKRNTGVLPTLKNDGLFGGAAAKCESNEQMHSRRFVIHRVVSKAVSYKMSVVDRMNKADSRQC